MVKQFNMRGPFRKQEAGRPLAERPSLTQLPSGERYEHCRLLVLHCPLQQSAFVPALPDPVGVQVWPIGNTVPVAMQHLRMVPTWLHVALPVHCVHTPPSEPQFAFVVPRLHMAAPEASVPQHPSQLAAEQRATH